VASALAKKLREVDKVDFIIALTHSTNAFDIKFAEAVPEIDLVLGGHNHCVLRKMVNGTLVLKSGSNFREFSVLKFYHKDFAPAGAYKLKGRYAITA
jgi:2',3'-cyclic-nucleotide 2'-phosphodiesterase (5'-nucleotidase family)